ncbi:DegV family protein [Allocoprobacillus halotolerans]|uniref:DegV family protein n=1 Tax=Allocoprobacillus halotolerans TaxID=2944914 RepID=A0ABY5I612_9FIRM|nr:DegV family protein [Allocoprobacillus halotolerans]UTY40207.1 DegV family protein [Allocoprobacillus halotolerans]
MIKIITDSTADIDLEYAKELNIDVVPLKVIINGREYKDRVDLQPDEFYDLLVNSETLPSTSQPSPQDFANLYEQAKENQESVIVITLSSTISGTYQSANLAKELVEYDDIYVVDSLGTTQMQRLLVLKAIALRNEEMVAKDIFTFLEDYKKRLRLYAFVDTLEYLYKGGRLSKTVLPLIHCLNLNQLLVLMMENLKCSVKLEGHKKLLLKSLI